MERILRILAVLIFGTSLAADAASGTPDPVRNIVLVHGAIVDGSAWHAVYNVLANDGYRVSIVQEPLTGFAEDVAATRRVIEQQDGPVVLVGHSYGGTIITVAGADSKVRALVYVAALQPDVGETTNQLAASRPSTLPPTILKQSKDGFIFIDRTAFPGAVAADLPRAQAKFLADAQMPVAAAAFDTPVAIAAWHDRPSYGIIATEDRELNPAIARWMYARSGAEVTEIKASHLVFISHPGEVARVIERASRSVPRRLAVKRYLFPKRTLRAPDANGGIQ